MSALEQAIAGRPGWELLSNGNARYAHADPDRVALLSPVELLQVGWGFDCEIFAQAGRGARLESWFELDATEAVAEAEELAGV